MKIYKVGGSVRDKLLDIPTKDFDYAVEADSFDAMRAEIQKRGYQIYLETPKYFTIRAHGPEGAADFSLCRKDGIYKDGRHPESVEPASIQDDLARRDFTCNAIAIDIDTGAILDPHGGQEDIKAGILKSVGKPQDRFAEDALRAFRAIRFVIVKNLSPDFKLLHAIKQMNAQDFAGVSTDRIRDELFKMMQFSTVESILWLNEFPEILKLIREREIWFKPTSEKK